MLLKYMTTEQFIESVEALGFEVRTNKTYDVNFVDIQDKDGETTAYVDASVQYKMSVRKVTEGYDYNTLFQIMCAYASTPVSEREPKMYKLKILDTNLYLIHINEYETTVTTNRKAAKAYDSASVCDAKVLAEKQGFALRAEVIDVTN